jgi:hypothetical protein
MTPLAQLAAEGAQVVIHAPSSKDRTGAVTDEEFFGLKPGGKWESPVRKWL